MMEAAEEISFKIRTSLTEPPPLWGGGQLSSEAGKVGMAGKKKLLAHP